MQASLFQESTTVAKNYEQDACYNIFNSTFWLQSPGSIGCNSTVYNCCCYFRLHLSQVTLQACSPCKPEMMMAICRSADREKVPKRPQRAA